MFLLFLKQKSDKPFIVRYKLPKNFIYWYKYLMHNDGPVMRRLLETI